MRLQKPVSLAIGLFVLLLGTAHARAQLSLFLTFSTDASGITLGGSGTTSATMALGTIRAYGGTVPSGVTRTVNGSTSMTLSTPFDITVSALNILVPNFTLTARLTADAVNTWKVNSVNISSGTTTTITTTGAYNTTTPYTFSLTIPFSEAAGLISNTINVTATGN